MALFFNASCFSAKHANQVVEDSKSNPEKITATLLPPIECEISKIGSLKDKYLPEASGIAHSQFLPHIFYHLTDDSKHLIITDEWGGDLRKIKINNVPKFDDPEDLAQGPCFQDRKCLVVADVGNNKFVRDEGRLYILEEKYNKTQHQDPELFYLGGLRLSYPKPSPDIEALAMHPIHGDFYLFTKEFNDKHPAKVAVYHIASTEIKDAIEKNKSIPLKAVGELDLRNIVDLEKKSGYRVTSADFSSDGRILVLLLHQGAIAIGFKDPNNIDLSQGLQSAYIAWARALEWENLEQQEAITFLPDGKTLLYSTENRDGNKKTPLMHAKCVWPTF